ncbi:hypothetical protein M3M35_03565 [Fructilactobacillus myrtifloralis]|uniref:Phage gp6-like head-tail connector protein n=1 Tax=Fructilactobacillus myrtifloralis TaxID=2940301 RepID=A0ABY5BPW2_9LACO|nr:hypothetical protein [Fructilactobacillus myrtifloralis]USS85723.1 hypothetical protein M3M35_03565 [Fructilactobacillus myrtifloralis]
MIPENMEEVHKRLAERQAAGDTITETALVYETVCDLLQNYLDNAEDGHYDSVQPVDDQTLAFVSVMGRQLGTYHAQGKSLVDDFQTNSFQMLLDLEEAALKIAGSR